jgi:hypothetical protein
MQPGSGCESEPGAISTERFSDLTALISELTVGNGTIGKGTAANASDCNAEDDSDGAGSL